jgi:hypothetical protein
MSPVLPGFWSAAWCSRARNGKIPAQASGTEQAFTPGSLYLRRRLMSTKVTMLLTEKDVENTNKIHQLTQSRTKAQAVSIALALGRFLVEQRRSGAQLQLRHPDGTVERIVMTELENISPGNGKEQGD